MVANSIDKALSLAKPLNYSEIVTYTVIIQNYEKLLSEIWIMQL